MSFDVEKIVKQPWERYTVPETTVSGEFPSFFMKSFQALFLHSIMASLMLILSVLIACFIS
jgi:hypothetical protein